MPANEFEKQVQQKMEELKLQPADQVWVEVEKRIRLNKKRRRIIFWWFFGGVLITAGTLFYIFDRNKPGATLAEQQANKTNTETTSPAITQKDTNQQQYNSNPSTNTSINPESTIVTSKPASKAGIIPAKHPAVSTNEQLMVTMRQGGISRKKNSTNAQSNKDKKTNEITTTKRTTEETIVQPGQQDVAIISAPVKSGLTDTSNMNKVVSQPEIIKKDNGNTTPVSLEQDSLIKTNLVRQDTVATKPVENKNSNAKKGNKNKWEYGVVTTTGFSGRVSGLSLGAEKLMVSSPGGSPAQTASFVSRRPTGFSWQVGVYAKRKFTERTGIAVGLEFTYYSGRQPVGDFVDSTRTISNPLYSDSFQGFYSNGISFLYRNHYSYLQIPVSFHWQINRGKKLPLVWQNGFSVGLLTGSNALQYDPGNNVFYRDNRLLNKTQFSLQSGLQARLFNGSRRPVTLGFVYNYHISQLQKINYDGKNHLFSFGVQLGWVIKK